MDSVERDQRKEDKLSERGEKLYIRRTRDDHKNEKKHKKDLRKNVEGITK